MNFLTNGYDYWFARGSRVNVEDFGMVAVLDYFNCKIDGQPFRSLCRTATVRRRFGDTEDIWALLWSDNRETFTGAKKLEETDVESLIEKPLEYENENQ
jgi:hypothetical protein